MTLGKIRFIANLFQSYFFKGFWNEQRKTFGPCNKGKTIYIIRRRDYTAGLFSDYTFVLGHLKYAIDKGWDPVVDFKNYRNSLVDSKQWGLINSWDCFFDQPGRVTLDEAYKSANVVLSDGGIKKDMPNVSMGFFDDKEEISYWRNLVHDHVGIKQELLKQIDNEWNTECGSIPSNKVLGVLLRGTDYINLKPSKHPVQPTVEETEKVISGLMKKNSYECIYIATEDKYILSEIKRMFGDKVRYKEGYRFDHDTSKLLYKADIGTMSKKDKNQEYLISIGILSKCGAFWGGRTSGTVSVLLLADKYEEFGVWNAGEYE